MTANVRVVTDSRESVLKVPNAALRMRITGVEPASAAASGPARAGLAASTSDWRGGFFISQAQAQGGAGGGAAALRERLVSELQLSAEQQARLDAVSAEMRSRFGAIRELPEDQRRAARDQVMAEMRQKITTFLTPTQKTQYQRMQEQGDAARGAGGPPPAAAAASAPAPTPSAFKNIAKQPAPTGAQPAMEAAAPVQSAAPAGAPGGGGALAEFRNRLVTELQLSAGQVEKVDAIYAEARPRFARLRELGAEERPKARERITADVRARIGDLLTPEQKLKYAALVAETAGRGNTRGRIYLLDAQGKPRAYSVRLGITDGTSTELLVAPSAPEAQELKEGAAVIVGALGGSASGNKPAGGPRMPF
jgi:Spy/CpxP family protein refolding chaperone